ncbi:MAG: hydroxymethylbilane synthase [Coraliomargaritaceae bacterium]
MSNQIKIATRKSPLARRQTDLVCDWLKHYSPDTESKILPLSTKIDERLSWSLEQRGGIGLFTKELEEALLDGRADLAVHSAKDLPTTFKDDLVIVGYLPRARAYDVLVYRQGCPKPATIATGSPRRRAQIQHLHPQAEFTTIRGNVATRLEKITSGESDATLLAAAGLDRLEIKSYKGLAFSPLSVEQVVPAPGQAAIAIQCRRQDMDRYKDCFCADTKLAVSLERAFLRRLGSGCQTPVGAYYAAGKFHIFHPDTGYQNFSLEVKREENIEPALDEILITLKL